MNNQEVFDRVVTHAMSQMEKSSEPGKSTTCLYRGPEGRKCFVGALIPDDIYMASMENKNVMGLCQDYPDVKALLKDNDLNLMTNLQKIHDNYKPEDWRDRLFRVAFEYELSTKMLGENLTSPK